MTTGIDAQTCKLIVLDSNIKSMTEFKQIIGRGTRINEDYDKTFFAIMDFRNVTDLFADPAFDGNPVMIKQVKGEEELTDQDINPEEDQEIIDPETGKPVDFDKKETKEYPTQPEIIQGGLIVSEPRSKVYVAGVDVSVLNERVQHLDANGKLITETLKDFTKKSILQEFRSLDDFLAKWNSAHKKKTVIVELESHGVIIENLMAEVKKDLDIFDLICHIAWDMPALTRRERAEKVKKRNYFTKYGEKARIVIDALLDKYASEGIENIEDLSVLRIDPFNQIGTPIEILQIFGGKEEYLHVIEKLENELYAAA
jgi:type I restriction enzyme, R subunit